MDEKETKRAVVLFGIALIILIVIILIYIIVTKKTGASKSSTTSLCTAPPPPTGVTAVSYQVVNIQVSWNAVSNADAYRIYVGTVPGFTKSNSFADYFTRSPSYIISNLTLGRTYYIFVESIGPCGNLSKSVSATVTVQLKFPARFRIVSRENPNLCLGPSANFGSVVLVPICTGTSPDNLCVWRYDETTGYIVEDSSTVTCMKTYPTSIDTRVVLELCSTISYYNWTAARQWNYDPSNGSLCNPQNPEGLNCIKISGNAIPNQTTVRTPFDNTASMQWDIVEVL